MPTIQEARELTLQLSPELYRAITEIAHNHSLGVNVFIHKQLEAIVRMEEENVRYKAYTLLGQDAEDCDVEYATVAQAEVMLRDKGGE